MAHMDPDFDYHSSVDGKEPGFLIIIIIFYDYYKRFLFSIYLLFHFISF